MFRRAACPSSIRRRRRSLSSGFRFVIVVLLEVLDGLFEFRVDLHQDSADSVEQLDHVVKRCPAFASPPHAAMIASSRSARQMADQAVAVARA